MSLVQIWIRFHGKYGFGNMMRILWTRIRNTGYKLGLRIQLVQHKSPQIFGVEKILKCSLPNLLGLVVFTERKVRYECSVLKIIYYMMVQNFVFLFFKRVGA